MVFVSRALSTVCFPADLLSSAQGATNSRKAAVAQGIGNNAYASGGEGGGNKKTVDAAAALGLGAPQQNTMLSGVAGLGMVQQNSLDSLFGSMGTNTMP